MPDPKTFDGTVPKVIAKVTFIMLENGQVQASAESASPFAVFSAIGQGTAIVAAEFQKQAAQRIQVAPAGLLAALPNGHQ